MLKKERIINTLHPGLELLYDKLCDKTSRNEKDDNTRDLFDKLCDQISK